LFNAVIKIYSKKIKKRFIIKKVNYYTYY